MARQGQHRLSLHHLHMDLDPIRNSCRIILVLHPHSWPETYSREGIHLYCPIFVHTRSHDTAPRSVLCLATRWGSRIPDEEYILIISFLAYVSMQRIEKFLAEVEVPDWASSLKMSGKPSVSSNAIGFEDGVFEWDVAPRDVQSRFRLGPLNIKFPKEKLTLVSGATGSGKSALLAALLGGELVFSASAINPADCLA